MSTSKVRTPQTVQLEHGGKWLAWTPDGLTILAVGDSPEAVKKAALAREPDPAIGWDPAKGVTYQWVPPADERFIGSGGV